MGQNPENDTARPQTTSRRAFLGLMAGAGAALAGGCSSAVPVLSETMAGPAPDPGTEGTTTTADLLGPEPKSFVSPAPRLTRPAGADPVLVEADVCVVGGGAAGTAAATAAARQGARTVLLEESHVLGGNMTRGLAGLAPVAGPDGPMVAGYFQEIWRRLEDDGLAVYPSADTGHRPLADLDALRHALILTCRQAGADVRLGAPALWVQMSEGGGRLIKSLWAAEQATLTEVRAKVFIDCTGDGHLGHQAGNAYWLGDRAGSRLQGQTLVFCAAPVDFERLASFVRSTGDGEFGDQGVTGLQRFFEPYRDNTGFPAAQRCGAAITRGMERDTAFVAASETFENHLEPGGLVAIMRSLEEQNRRLHEAMRRDLPGFEKSHLLRMAERPHIREGRRLVGHYQLHALDLLTAAKPDDSIARGWHPISLHIDYQGEAAYWGAAPADWYGIPYRCLVAQDLDNLMMAGRCMSVTHEALGSTGVSPLSMALGQAAGVAAAQAAATGFRPADLPVTGLRQELVRQGCLI